MSANLIDLKAKCLLEFNGIGSGTGQRHNYRMGIRLVIGIVGIASFAAFGAMLIWIVS